VSGPEFKPQYYQKKRRGGIGREEEERGKTETETEREN
jgi:hypothetical protein